MILKVPFCFDYRPSYFITKGLFIFKTILLSPPPPCTVILNSNLSPPPNLCNRPKMYIMRGVRGIVLEWHCLTGRGQLRLIFESGVLLSQKRHGSNLTEIDQIAAESRFGRFCVHVLAQLQQQEPKKSQNGETKSDFSLQFTKGQAFSIKMLPNKPSSAGCQPGWKSKGVEEEGGEACY